MVPADKRVATSTTWSPAFRLVSCGGNRKVWRSDFFTGSGGLPASSPAMHSVSSSNSSSNRLCRSKNSHHCGLPSRAWNSSKSASAGGSRLFACRCFQEPSLIVGVTRFAFLAIRCLVGGFVGVVGSGRAVEPGDIPGPVVLAANPGVSRSRHNRPRYSLQSAARVGSRLSRASGCKRRCCHPRSPRHRSRFPM